jgi:hypothetical protein
LPHTAGFRQRQEEHRRQETLPFSHGYPGELLPEGYQIVKTREVVPGHRPSDKIRRTAELNDFTNVISKITNENFSLKEIDDLADRFAISRKLPSAKVPTSRGI